MRMGGTIELGAAVGFSFNNTPALLHLGWARVVASSALPLRPGSDCADYTDCIGSVAAWLLVILGLALVLAAIWVLLPEIAIGAEILGDAAIAGEAAADVAGEATVEAAAEAAAETEAETAAEAAAAGPEPPALPPDVPPNVPPDVPPEAPGPSDPVGRSDSPIEIERGTNPPDTIDGRDYSGHALDRMQGRGLTPSTVENTIETGQPFPGNTPGTTGYYDPVNNVSVITNQEGGVITVRFGPP